MNEQFEQYYNHMNAATLILLLLMTILRNGQQKVYQRLQPGMKFEKDDELVSTLGWYKLMMNDTDCSMNVYKFNETLSSYLPINQKIGSNLSVSCTYFQVLDRSIVTNASVTLFQLSQPNLSRVYFIIDDTGVARFIGYKNPSINPSDYVQIITGNYSQPNGLVRILEGRAQITDRLNSAIVNSNKWSFQTNGLILTITNLASQFSQSFTLPNAYFDTNGIYDMNNQTIPATIFNGIKLDTVCGTQKGQLLGPFIIQINNFWPIMTIYDQERYKLFEFSILQNQMKANPCPKFTFLLRDQCVTLCPTPYLHSIQDSWGVCVLNCEADSIIDEIKKTCVCPNRPRTIAPNYFCINSSLSYPFGCYCQNGTFFDRPSHTCLSACLNQTVAYQGLCLNCRKGCQRCSVSFNGLYYIICSKCSPGFNLSNGACVYNSTCTANCLTCDQKSICTACLPFFTLINGTCKAFCLSGTAVIGQNLTASCMSQSNQCGPQCLKCGNNSNCIVCHLGYSLFVSPLFVTCRKRNLLYSCQSEMYAYSNNEHVCYSNDSSSVSKLSNCFNTINNCLICHPTLTNTCLLCKNTLFLQQNTCVSKCSSGFFQHSQACIPSVPQCSLHSFFSNSYKQTYTQDYLNSNSFYSSFIRNGNQSSNQPYGFQLYFAQQFMFKNDSISLEGELESIQLICSQCRTGFGLTSDHTTCLPCPKNCLLCLYVNSCLATTTQQMRALTGISPCQSFLSHNNTCLSSCPTSTFPTMNTTLNQIICVNDSVGSSEKGYLRVDGSTYVISNNQYIHRFIFDSPVTTKTARILQAAITNPGSNLSIDDNGNSITFSSNSPTQILNLTGELTKIRSASGLYPANSIYGINYETSFRSYIKKWLAGVGYVLSILIILLQCVYVANGIMYKMDNIIIFTQSLFFFLFTQTLIANPIAQFYYGWSWTHLNFFPNYFTPDLDLSEPTIPPYALYNLDGNVIRNAGSTLSFLFTFLMAWGVISFSFYMMDTYYGRKQVWFQKISRNSLIAVVEFFSYNIFYWCMAFITHEKNYSNSGVFIGLSVLLLTLLIVYLLVRLYTNLMGGLYMVKRLIYACVLAASFERVGYVGVMIVLEGIFGVARSLIQKPRQKWLLISLWIEQGLLIIFWIILYTTTNASVVSILTTIFVYGWMLTFVADLADLYFHSRNRYVEVSCFRKLFEEPTKESGRSSEGIIQQEKEGTDRPFSINPGPQ